MPPPQLARIIVVDDEPELAAVLSEMLAEQSFEAMAFTSGEDGLEAIKSSNFDLLLTDLMMPGMDGIELLQCALEIDPDLVPIVMTGQGTIETAVEAMRSGAFDYVLKPFKLGTLLPTLSRAIEYRQLRMENVQLRESVAIYELSQAIACTLDLNTVLNKVADAAIQQCDADEASVMVPTREGNELYVVTVRGEERGALLGARTPIGEGVAGWVAKNREPLTLNGEVDDARFAPRNPRTDIRSAVSMPMLVGGKLVGVLNVNATHRRRPFTLGQVKALSILAGTAASALESAWLYEQVREAEEKYRAIFENAVEGIYQTTPDGQFLTANPAMARILGYESVDELMSCVTNIAEQTYVDPRDRLEFVRCLEAEGQIQGAERLAKRRDGSQIWLAESAHVVRDEEGHVLHYEGVVEDVTSRKEAAARQDLTARVLDALNNSTETTDTVRSILLMVKEFSGFEAVGIRLREGADFPYYETIGLSSEFVEAERHLCARDAAGELVEDSEGNPVLECMCGNVICGRTRPDLPFFTEGGSFWTNSTSELLASTSEEDRQARTRNRCNGEGYESVALIPLQSDSEVVGLLQLNDRRTNRLSIETIEFFEDLGASIGIALHRDQTEREVQALLRLHESTLGTIPSSLLVLDKNLNILMANQQCLAGRGAQLSEVIGKGVEQVFPESLLGEQLLLERMRSVAAEGGTQELLDVRHMRSEHDEEHLNIWICGIHSPTGRDGEPKLVLVVQDVTEQRVLEDQLRQSAKIETVGQLAGGVAHDFNNLLTGIKGYTQLLLGSFEPDSAAHHDLSQIQDLSDRAADLTRQLLAFSRKQKLDPVVLSINSLIDRGTKMLGRLIGENIELQFIPGGDLGAVLADPGQVEQVLMNLAVNARDAMPEGGKLTIETTNVTLDADYVNRHVSVTPGHYVMLAASDTGCGMDDETMEHIFEPFFTTKEQGKGTGLGLATVYGIVKQHDGNIWVYSELGKGTTFKIYLPRVEAEEQELVGNGEATPPPRGTETVLLVEDERAVLDTAKRTLVRHGYQVLSASCPAEASVLFGQHGDDVDLLLTDVVMPGSSGRTLYEKLSTARPTLRVLYMSGYTDNAIVQHGVLDDRSPFIQKPFAPSALLTKVRQVLDDS